MEFVNGHKWGSDEFCLREQASEVMECHCSYALPETEDILAMRMSSAEVAGVQLESLRPLDGWEWREIFSQILSDFWNPSQINVLDNNLRIINDMVLQIPNRKDSHSYRRAFMVETENWAEQTCFGIMIWGARKNIVNMISWQNLSHFDAAFVLNIVSHLCSTCVCVNKRFVGNHQK